MHWLKMRVLGGMAIAALISCQPFPLLQSNQTRKSKQPITLKLSGWGASPSEQTLLRQVLQEFEAQHPHIKVQHEVIAEQYMDVLKTRLIGDAAPDVFYLDVSEAPFLMRQPVLEPLDSYINPDFDLKDFEPSLLNAFKYQGKIYGLPKDFSTLALFYNKQAFAAAGLTRPPQTWNELLVYSKRLTIDKNGDSRIDQYGLGITPELARLAFMIKAFGGKLIDDQGYAAFATESGIKGLRLVVDQYRQDRSAAQKSDVGVNSGSEMLGQGKVAMVLEGNWAIPYLAETFPNLQFGTAEVPPINQKPGTMVFTVAYVMSKQSQHKSAAWQLISYLTGKEGMKRWTSTGFALPTRKSVARELGYGQDPLRAAFLAGVDYATPWQAGEHLSAIMTSFDNQFISALLGQQPLEQAMAKAQKNANQQIRATEGVADLPFKSGVVGQHHQALKCLAYSQSPLKWTDSKS
ncbi:MAG: ABC transporter substrate-binding protein, partial [Leptolyngbyaceae bacterium]|nr:ABC transporter substrate-binding protein [Leptolyngbyaceae bacterium]